MSENQYLEELQQALGNLNETERHDIIRDFHEYFESGRSEGKTSEEIISSLGTADEIAQELLKAYSEEEFVQQVAFSPKQSSTKFTKVKIVADRADIVILPATNDEVYSEIEDHDDKTEVETNIVNDTLKISVKRKAKKLKILSFSLNIRFDSKALVTIYIPQVLYEKITVKSDFGAISIEQFQTKELKVKNDVGAIKMSSILAANVDVTNNMGNITMKKCNFMRVSCKSDIGKIVVDESIATSWNLKTDTNRIECHLVAGEVEAKSSVGSIIYNAPSFAFPIRLKTDVGNIEVTTEQIMQDGVISAKSDLGSISVYGNSDKKAVYGNGEIEVELRSNIGKIQVINSN